MEILTCECCQQIYIVQNGHDIYIRSGKIKWCTSVISVLEFQLETSRSGYI